MGVSDLNSIYFNPRSAGSFGGKARLYRIAKEHYPKIRLKDVSKWLQQQDTYSLFRPVKRKFKRLPILVKSLNEQVQADLLDMSWYSRYNDNVKYLLVVINVLSRYVWVRPLKAKDARSITDAFKTIFSRKNKPEKIQTDQGKEFVNKHFKEWCKENDILFFTTTNDDIKCAIVERFNRTLRERLYRLMHYENSFRYIDDLQSVVHGYNTAYHSTIKMSPNEVTRANEMLVIKNIRQMRMKGEKFKQTNKLKSGSTVRIARKKKLFEKGAESGWSEELFRITKSKQTPLKFIYKLEDLSGEPITSIFYPEEIQESKEKNVYKVEKILRKRIDKKTKTEEFLIKWKGYPSKFNTWLPKAKLQTLSK